MRSDPAIPYRPVCALTARRHTPGANTRRIGWARWASSTPVERFGCAHEPARGSPIPYSGLMAFGPGHFATARRIFLGIFNGPLGGRVEAISNRHFSVGSISAHDGARHRCTTDRSSSAPRNTPSGENVMCLNCPPLASSVSSSCLPSTSQSLMASRPSLPVTRRLSSGENDAPWTPCKKFRNVATSRSVAMSNSRQTQCGWPRQ